MTEELKQKAENSICKIFNITKDELESLKNDWDFAERLENYIALYIAGATENGLVWHDLREDPNDLPKEKKDVFVLYKFKRVGVMHLEWNKEWWGNGTYCAFEGVIKWAEINLSEE